MLFYSRSEGSKCVSMTWRAISVSPTVGRSVAAVTAVTAATAAVPTAAAAVTAAAAAADAAAVAAAAAAAADNAAADDDAGRVAVPSQQSLTIVSFSA